MTTDTMHRSGNGSAPSQGQAPERLADAASGLLDQAGRTATTQASRTMDRAGETLEQVARVVRDSGNQLRQDRPEIAGVVDTVAERVEQASTYLREHDAQQVIGEVERFARRQPALVVGGGLVVGLLAGRLLRSGAEPMTNGSSSRQFAQGSSSWPTGSTPGSGYGTGYGATLAESTGTDRDTAMTATGARTGTGTRGRSGTGTTAGSVTGSASGSIAGGASGLDAVDQTGTDWAGGGSGSTADATGSTATRSTKRRSRSTGAE